MPRLLIVSTTTGYQTRAFGDAAARQGIEPVFATDRCHVLDNPWRDAAIPIRFHDEAASVRAILTSAIDRPVDGVLALGDRPAVVAALAARELGLPGPPPDAARTARSKRLSKQRWAASGLSVPWFRSFPVDADPADLASLVRYPCVVKPAALSASRGVIRADDPASFVRAFDRVRLLLHRRTLRATRDEEGEWIAVEQFIEGAEFAVEGYIERGHLHPFAIFDKPDPLDGPFFEETIYVTPSRLPAEAQAAVVHTIAAAAAALGLDHGPIHAECRINTAGVFPLEVAARPIGGLCARALKFHSQEGGERREEGGGEAGDRIQEGGTQKAGDRRNAMGLPGDQDGPRAPLELEDVLVRLAVGEPVSRFSREDEASGVLMLPVPRRGRFKGVSGVDEARRIDGIEDVVITAKADQLLEPAPEGSSYPGFVFARGSTPDAVEQALRSAQARLHFDLADALLAGEGESEPE